MTRKPSTLTLICTRCGGPCSTMSDSRMCRMCCRLPWEPSPDEIAAGCIAAQKEWNVHRWRREIGKTEEARTHEVHDPRSDME